MSLNVQSVKKYIQKMIGFGMTMNIALDTTECVSTVRDFAEKSLDTGNSACAGRGRRGMDENTAFVLVLLIIMVGLCFMAWITMRD